MLKIKNKKLCESCFSVITGEPCKYCGFSKRKYNPTNGTLPIGSVLSKRYIIGEVIGQGGFGITYRAYDKMNDKILAIKEYYPNTMVVRNADKLTVTVSTNQSKEIFRRGIERFYDEAKLVSKFNGNPNIVSVYDCFYENETAYLVMELINGETLKSYIKKNGTLSSAQALFVFEEITNALMISHSRKLLHRDISPDNIMLCENGGLKLIDFGAAREVMDDNQKSMSVILKNGYAPPEQYQRHGNQGPWTDIYSLGATIYYLLTKETLDDPMSRLGNEGELENNYGIDKELWEIIVRSIKLKVSERYQNAFELRKALEQVSYKSVLITESVQEDADIDKTILVTENEKENQKILPKSSPISEEKKYTVEKSSYASEENKSYFPKNKVKNIKAEKDFCFKLVGAVACIVILACIGVAAFKFNYVKSLDTKSENITVTQEETTVKETTIAANIGTVTFVDESGNALDTYNVELGTTILSSKIPNVPEKAGYSGVWVYGNDNAEFTENTIIKYNLTVKPMYATQYTLAFVDESGNALATYSIGLGKTILSSKIPNVPEKAGYSGVWVYGDDNTKFTVNTIIKDNLIVKPMYTIQCTVTFTDKNGNVYETATVVSGEKISSLPNVPQYFDFGGSWVYGDDNVEFNRKTIVSDNIIVKPMYTKVKIGEKYYNLDSTELDLSNLGLDDSDIKNLKYMTNLTYLDLYDNQITDVSVLANLTELISLRLSGNQISDINSLSKLTNLEYLDLSDNRISDVSPLANGQIFKLLSIFDDNTCNDKDDYIASFVGITMADDGEIYIQNSDFTEEDFYKAMLNVKGTFCAYFFGTEQIFLFEAGQLFLLEFEAQEE